MPTFEHQPDWWISLANLTQWLHWPAISAIVAGAAWWRTGSLADRARREERRKDAAFLLGVAILLEAALQPYRKSVLGVREGKLAARQFRASIATAETTGVTKRLSDLKVTEFPTPNSSAIFLAAEVKLRQLEIVAKELADEQATDAEAATLRIVMLQHDIAELVQTARVMTDVKVEYDQDSFLQPLVIETESHAA